MVQGVVVFELGIKAVNVFRKCQDFGKYAVIAAIFRNEGSKVGVYKPRLILYSDRVLYVQIVYLEKNAANYGGGHKVMNVIREMCRE